MKLGTRFSKGLLLVKVYYRPLDQGKPVTEALLQLQEASNLQAFFLMGNFNHPNGCWEINTVNCKQSKRILESIEDNFLVQVLDRPTRNEALLDLVLTNAGEIIKERG